MEGLYFPSCACHCAVSLSESRANDVCSGICGPSNFRYAALRSLKEHTLPPIVYIDTSTVRDGKLEEVKAAVRHLAKFVEENMPRLTSYRVFFDDAGRRMTVVALHPDSASLEYHMEVGAAEFQKFSGLIDLSRIDVYGPISQSVVERLHAKARMLGSDVVNVHQHYAGFAR